MNYPLLKLIKNRKLSLLTIALVFSLMGCKYKYLSDDGFCVSSLQLQECVIEAVENELGIVYLHPKTYYLGNTVNLPSDFTIEGTEGETNITWSEDISTVIDEPMFYAQTADNVEIKNVKLTGAIDQSPTSEDIRNDHIGIYFECEGDALIIDSLECQNITLSNIEVENFSHGVHIKGAYNVTAIDLDLHNNGNTEVDLFHNIYLRRVNGYYMVQNDPQKGGLYNSPRGHGFRASYLYNANIDFVQIFGNADHGINFSEVGNIVFNYVDNYDNCANPSGNCSQYACYGDQCDVKFLPEPEPVLSGLTMEINSSDTVDLTWSITGLPENATKIEIFRNTINSTSGRTLISAVPDITGSFTDVSVQSGTDYWYMFKILLSTGETVNTEPEGPITVPGSLALTNLDLALGNDGQSIDLTWALTGFSENNKVELFRNTIDGTSGRTKVATVPEAGTYNDSSIEVGIDYWYMFKIATLDGNTINTEPEGPFQATGISGQQTNLIMAQNTSGTGIDLSWNLLGFPEIIKVEIFRNTIDGTSGRKLIKAVDLRGELTDSSAESGVNYWYMFKLALPDGTTLNTEPEGPVCYNCGS